MIRPRSAYVGDRRDAGAMYLTYQYTKRITLPGLIIQLLDRSAAAQSDIPMMGRQLFFTSLPKLLMENLMINRGQVRKSAAQAAALWLTSSGLNASSEI